MKIYLVGGAVRDQLLGKPIRERDWVVVGATEQQLIQQGFTQVGKIFPVFLHPHTKEEYALARTERKTGPGYGGFTCQTSQDIPLEEDLKRRDLTINAMAQTSDGAVIDPYAGQSDLKNKVLRHVSPAFSEDPLRVLRAARFAAQLDGFKIHPDTMTLMKTIVQQNRLEELAPERIFQELKRALQTRHSEYFFQTLQQCQALPHLFPKFTYNQHNEQRLQKITSLTHNSTLAQEQQSVLRFSVLFSTGLPTEEAIKVTTLHYQLPRQYSAFTQIIHRNYLLWQQLDEVNPAIEELVFTFLKNNDAIRRAHRFQQLLFAYQSLDKQTNTNKASRILHALRVIRNLKTPQEILQKPSAERAQLLDKIRVQAIKEARI